MPIKLSRKNIYFRPDSKRVLARYFNLSDERKGKVILRILALNKTEKEETLNQLLRNFSNRHRNIIDIWEDNFKKCMRSNLDQNILKYPYLYKDKLLIGAYFTMEYSVESAAFFNPSIVESPDQTRLGNDEKRIILSFRAIGEGHVSSIVFRTGIIDDNLDIKLDKVSALLERPKQIKNYVYYKKDFFNKLFTLDCVTDQFYNIVFNKFPDSFIYEELRLLIHDLRKEYGYDSKYDQFLNHLFWLASSHYQITYSIETSISERVIFPVSDTEKNGIEDARFLKFNHGNGKFTYYATYTAYDGINIMPKLLSTKDFVTFKIQPINGKIANKGSALFPRKIKGKYAMLCRIDGEKNYISFSNDLINWQEDIILLNEPQYSWEFIQVGNCGAPIETDKGWLILTHSVGPMREYTISASLLDLEDPTKIIGSLKEPLLYPNQEEREGYVPNVVYSCGQIIHHGFLIIPYAMSDHSSTYATINLDDLLTELLENPKLHD